MGIEEQIQRLNNAQDFTKLCNAVFTARYGTEYQPVDGTRADSGNDGYITSEKTLLAFFCPIKPASMSDRKYRKKIREDLDKAVQLNQAGHFEIKKWTFVTPGKLSNVVLSYLRQEAHNRGFEGAHLESTFLANELWLHPRFWAEFPWLKIVDVDERLRKLEEIARQTQVLAQQKSAERQNRPDLLVTPKTQTALKDPDFQEVVKLLQSRGDQNSKVNLRIIFYKTANQVVKVNALIGLLQFYDPAHDDPQEMIGLCENGIQIADFIGANEAKAIFLAHKGMHLAEIFSREDAESAVMIRAGNLMGIPVVSEAQRTSTIDRLHRLDDQSKTAFGEALQLAGQTKNPYVVAYVTMKVGHAAGTRFIHLNGLGAKERAVQEKLVCKISFGLAKDLYAAMGYKLGVAYVLHNLANDLRFFGEVEEAKALTRQVIEVAGKLDDRRLLDDAQTLMRRLATGRIPDYVHGEDRNSV